jgi:hypothetical protein
VMLKSGLAAWRGTDLVNFSLRLDILLDGVDLRAKSASIRFAQLRVASLLLVKTVLLNLKSAAGYVPWTRRPLQRNGSSCFRALLVHNAHVQHADRDISCTATV